MDVQAVFDPLAALGYAAAILLGIYLLILVAILAGIAGGMAFGLRWVNGKTGWAFGKANAVLPLAERYTALATSYAAKPLILGGGVVARVTGTLEGMHAAVLEAREAEEAPPSAPAARPLPSPEPSVPEPARLP